MTWTLYSVWRNIKKKNKAFLDIPNEALKNIIQSSYYTSFLGRGSDLHTWQWSLVRWDVSGLVPPF